LAIVAALFITTATGATAAEKPSWIWGAGSAKDNETVYFCKVISLNKPTQSAKLTLSCDNGFEAFVNGKKVLAGGDWNNARTADVKKHLNVGRNVIAVRGWNEGSVAGLVGQLDIAASTSRHKIVNTDDSWRSSRSKVAEWETPGFDADGWSNSREVGELGVSPWGNVFAKAAKGSGGTPGVPSPEQLSLANGFKAELLHVVPKGEQGSWVALTEDHKGRLIASDQYGHLYRITPPKIGDDASKIYIEKIDVPIGHAQGLLWAFNSLYVVVNGGGIAGHGSGLYRVIDTNGDDKLDKVETLKKINGGGEHGPHDVILTPDKKNLYVVAGNHTQLPAKPVPLVNVNRTLLVVDVGFTNGKMFPDERNGSAVTIRVVCIQWTGGLVDLGPGRCSAQEGVDRTDRPIYIRRSISNDNQGRSIGLDLGAKQRVLTGITGQQTTHQ
jgi:hypothetical protein